MTHTMQKLLILLFFFLSACSAPDTAQKADPALLAPFAEYPGYDNRLAFYADLQQPSGTYRFYVLDLEAETIVDRGIVLHGREEAGKPRYSNVPDSHCSSRGMARLSYRYQGRFGTAYKLVGLEESNSNMMRRAIVLHAWRGVPDFEQPFALPNSQGCPTVSPGFLERLEGYMAESPEPVLLYIN